MTHQAHPRSFASTRNACKLCSPLGASVAFKGLRGCIPLIHGSQGCATYIRRYMISHFKEPVDIASTNFSEEAAIFGGKRNFMTGIDNIIRQYRPEVIAIASTCLSETIGDDVGMLIYDYKQARSGEDLPVFVQASTPSYQGNHMDGFHEAVAACVRAQATEPEKTGAHVNLFPGFISPEDLRYLKEILVDHGLPFIPVSDYSETLDNTTWQQYHKLPPGGLPVESLKSCSSALASIELGYIQNRGALSGRIKQDRSLTTAAAFLDKQYAVPREQLGLPIGIRETDRFMELVSRLSGVEMPAKYSGERGRLVDAYVDGHKYVFGKRAIVYGEEDMVVALTSLLDEIGIQPVLCASGGESGQLENTIRSRCTNLPEAIEITNGADFETIAERARELKPDIIIGHSKGYYIARELGIPIVRVGFPIHDRLGGQRILHLGYRGSLQLYDKIANALIQYKQDHSPVGYKYM